MDPTIFEKYLKFLTYAQAYHMNNLFLYVITYCSAHVSATLFRMAIAHSGLWGSCQQGIVHFKMFTFRHVAVRSSGFWHAD